MLKASIMFVLLFISQVALCETNLPQLSLEGKFDFGSTYPAAYIIKTMTLKNLSKEQVQIRRMSYGMAALPFTIDDRSCPYVTGMRSYQGVSTYYGGMFGANSSCSIPVKLNVTTGVKEGKYNVPLTVTFAYLRNGVWKETSVTKNLTIEIKAFTLQVVPPPSPLVLTTPFGGFSTPIGVTIKNTGNSTISGFLSSQIFGTSISPVDSIGSGGASCGDIKTSWLITMPPNSTCTRTFYIERIISTSPAGLYSGNILLQFVALEGGMWQSSYMPFQVSILPKEKISITTPPNTFNLTNPALLFGSVNNFTTSQAQYITIANSGDKTVTAKIQFHNQFPLYNVYTVKPAANRCPGYNAQLGTITLSKNAACDLSVTLTPKERKSYSESTILMLINPSTNTAFASSWINLFGGGY